MHVIPNERTALFIDGANLYSASRNLGFDVDYRNLLESFRSKCHLVRAYYYSALLDTEEYSPLKPLTDWLAYNGYALVTKTNATIGTLFPGRAWMWLVPVGLTAVIAVIGAWYFRMHSKRFAEEV